MSATPTGELSEPPPAPEAPDTPESRVALDVANRYFAALVARDIDTAIELLSPDVAIDCVRPRGAVEDYGMFLAWAAEDDPQCAPTWNASRAYPAAGSPWSAPTACTWG